MPADLDDSADLDLAQDDSNLSPEGSPPAQQTPPADDGKKDDLREAMLELTGLVKQSVAPKKEEKPLSPEEQNKLWAVYNPEAQDKDFFRKFFRLTEDMSPEQQAEYKQLFAGMQQGLMRQAVTAAYNLLQAEREKWDEELSPVREYVTQAKSREIRNEFNAAYPALADKKYDKVLKLVSTELAKRDFASREEYFKVLAESAANEIKNYIPDFDLGAQPTKKPAGTTPRLPRGGAGGTGGAGGGAPAKANGPKDDSDGIFD